MALDTVPLKAVSLSSWKPSTERVQVNAVTTPSCDHPPTSRACEFKVLPKVDHQALADGRVAPQATASLTHRRPSSHTRTSIFLRTDSLVGHHTRSRSVCSRSSTRAIRWTFLLRFLSKESPWKTSKKTSTSPADTHDMEDLQGKGRAQRQRRLKEEQKRSGAQWDPLVLALASSEERRRTMKWYEYSIWIRTPTSESGSFSSHPLPKSREAPTGAPITSSSFVLRRAVVRSLSSAS